MKQNILYVGLDVDDSQFHGSAFNKCTREVVDEHRQNKRYFA
jgi:hypothetical protein